MAQQRSEVGGRNATGPLESPEVARREGSTGTPVITVLITAYNRIPFVARALESACAQSLDPELFEILVVSNRKEHSEVAREARTRHPQSEISVALMEDPPLGEQLALGFELARGRVVSLLNDDDEWRPQKLARVASAFTSNPSLAYFKDGTGFIDHDGRELNHRPGPGSRTKRRVSSGLIIDSRDPGAIRATLRWNPIDFNDSSISVARDVVLGALPEMRSIRTNEDTFLFYVCAVSGRPLEVTDDPLTMYRVHGGGMSQSSRGDEESSWRKLIANDEGNSTAMEVIRRFALEHRRGDLLPLIERDCEYFRLVALTRRPEIGRADRARQLARFLPLMFRSRVPAGLRATGWATLSLLTRRAGRMGYNAVRNFESR
ncbi:MAG: glycosyltransferase family 2 protein [Euryarchaeota archaeon]|nr:glycosyltransferase family 2 protein [Euryarchaeota archaeon]MDE1837255.1 glycosyltransferase family 2 protein [Euryarchaeota archaeon]MDE1879925.1 glycosyltransferase family 2 protein [Euryarchaeota archaeon]MDE2045141.1 glycosyltransferase family 2 protein [Thermoplasmata archaeon]